MSNMLQMAPEAMEKEPVTVIPAAASNETKVELTSTTATSSPTSTTTEVVSVRTMIETATMTDGDQEERVESESVGTATETVQAEAKLSVSVKESVEAEEEPDTLSPLMTDNHTFLQHQELLREEPLAVDEQLGEEPGSSSSSPQHYHRHHHHHGHGVEEVHDYGIYDDDEQVDDDADDDDDDIEDDEDEMFMRDDHASGITPEPNMKHSDTKDSISSIDSDVSLSYDRRSAAEQLARRQNDAEDTGTGSSDDAAKDSGCEITKQLGTGTGEEPEPGTETGANDDTEGDVFEIPDDEACEKIVEQVEFYFSNENILKDAFLLKHVRRNKEGFVSLKLVSSFKRVRQLTKDWRVVGYAIKRKSTKIEVNDLGTKIRRMDALPEHDETTPSRTVVATGLPYDKYTVEKVSELFSKCGEISLIRVLRPGGPIPADVRQFINKHPELQQNECALVEFTESASARRAQALTEFVVLELVAPKKKTGKKATNVTKFVESYKFAANHDIERSRGGEGFDRFKMRRGSSGFYPRATDMLVSPIYQQQPLQPLPMHHHGHHHHHAHQVLPMMTAPMQTPMQAHQDPHQQQSPPMAPQYMMQTGQSRKYSFGNEQYECFQPQQPQQQRRSSAYSLGSDASRKFSNCSEGYSSCGEMSRRTSACSSEAMSRRTSACSSEMPSSRRSSNCSDFCSCNARRISQCSSDLMFRRMSQCSQNEVHTGQRKYSVGSSYDRKYANSPTDLLQQQQQQQAQQQGHLLQRRISMDSTGPQYDRKFSSGSITGYHTDSPNISPRKYSSTGGGFDPLRKLSNGSDQYYNGRKISTDSGYDRRISIGSECSGPRSRAGSILCSHANAGNTALPTTVSEAVVRTPIGPDGSKGFGTRTRRIGQIVPPA
ncbi:AGAP005345-PA-like protein [Anopheles sinensis]|uniref:AGAP005345-PA-like protein n=1 Tax=Anopheles sinensis TaxID=74873 RepID=A0A084W159_ANOSI|nr:AGAP005345-PA-like protein [Anopheles sinensis]